MYLNGRKRLNVLIYTRLVFQTRLVCVQRGIATLRKPTRHFPKAKWRAICTAFWAINVYVYAVE